MPIMLRRAWFWGPHEEIEKPHLFHFVFLVNHQSNRHVRTRRQGVNPQDRRLLWICVHTGYEQRKPFIPWIFGARRLIGVVRESGLKLEEVKVSNTTSRKPILTYFPELLYLTSIIRTKLNVLRHIMYTPAWVTTGWGVMPGRQSSRVVSGRATPIGNLLQHSPVKSALRGVIPGWL